MVYYRPDWSDELQTYQAEVSWRLGQWDKLKKTVQAPNKVDTGYTTLKSTLFEPVLI